MHVHVLLKHWTEGSCWKITENLFKVVQAKIKEVVSTISYFSITCNEVTTLDNHSWISIYIYTIQDWKIVPMLLCLQRVIQGDGVANITKIILGALTNESGLTPHQIRDNS